MNALHGRRAVVTGASRGIGRAVAEALSAEGADVIGVARSLGCDCTSPHDVAALAARVGTADLVVNAAGAFVLRPLAETTPEEFRAQLDTNVLGPFLVLRALLPAMAAAGRGHVITIGSIVDHQVFPGNAAYAASKWGVRALHEVARLEYAERGIRFSLISPGPTDTALWEGVAHQPANLLAADQVAAAVRFAATQPAGANVALVRINPRAPA